MAGETIVKPEPVAAVLKSDTCTELAEQDVASGKDGKPSILTSSISSSGNATSSMKRETVQGSVAQQGVYYPLTSCYDYCYPGYNGASTQLDDQNYFNAGGGSYTLGSGYQSGSLVKGFHPVGKYSSFINQNPGLFMHNSPTNYRPNGRVWNGNNRIKMIDTNGQFDASTELTRGPRAQNGRKPSNPSLEEEQLGPAIRRDQYNLEEFQTQYDDAKLYVIKSYSEDDIHKCIKYDVWSSTPNGNKKLDTAFHGAEAKASETGTRCPIFLFFSVNRSGQFVGVAEMLGPVDFTKDMDFWQINKWNGFFPVKWHIIKDIPNTQLRHIILENNDNQPVTYSRDTQEIGLKQGIEMLNIFKSYSGKSSVLDDFNFYESREKLLKPTRSRKQASSPTEMCKHNDIPKHLKTGERATEEAVRANGSSDTMSSLINLTNSLSVNSHQLKSGALMNPREDSVPSIPASKAF